MESLFPEISTTAERREASKNPTPEFTYVSMGAGVQSTTIALLIAEGRLPAPQFAVFSDTGWEPAEVYEHLNRIDRELLKPNGIELVRVAEGNIRDESIDPHFPVHLPLFTRTQDGVKGGLMRRQCTSNYKLGPIFRWLRSELGAKTIEKDCTYCSGGGERVAPWMSKAGDETVGMCSICRGSGSMTRVGSPPRGSWAEQWIGFSVDEIERVSPSRVPYATSRYPLLEDGFEFSRDDCHTYLAERGWGDTVKSACIGCPFHDNTEWRRIRDNYPDEWADAIEVDEKIRNMPGSTHVAYLHKDRVPLAEANLDSDSGGERMGCSPFGCRSGDPIDIPMWDLDADGKLF